MDYKWARLIALITLRVESYSDKYVFEASYVLPLRLQNNNALKVKTGGTLARIRKVEIRNFRSIRKLDWFPAAGMNCLIGPGDNGKSTLLDAIDLCLGARRAITLCDSDFTKLDTARPISITLTLGDLSAEMKNIDVYGE